MKTKMIVTDQDGSAIKGSIPPFYSGWDEVGECLPKELRKEWHRIRDYYYPKKELYSEWFQKQLELLKGIPVKLVTDKIFPLPYAPGFIEFFNSVPKGIVKGLLSAGIDLIAKKIQEEAGLDFIYANEVHIENGIFTGTGKEISGLWNKLSLLEKMAEEYEVLLNETCFIGDNLNDKECLEAVGYPHVISPHESVKGCGKEIKSYMEIILE